MQLTSLADWNCSVARTLDVVGEWWTLLIVRDALRGTRRFDDFQASLGVARSVLTARLKKLTDAGVLERAQYSDHPPRHEYRLTDKGSALFPVVTALLRWGDDWACPGAAPVLLVHETCGQIMHPALTCPRCGGGVGPANTRSVPGPGQVTGSRGPAAGSTSAAAAGGAAAPTAGW